MASAWPCRALQQQASTILTECDSLRSARQISSRANGGQEVTKQRTSELKALKWEGCRWSGCGLSDIAFVGDNAAPELIFENLNP